MQQPVPEFDGFAILPFPTMEYFSIKDVDCCWMPSSSTSEATSSVKLNFPPYMSVSEDQEDEQISKKKRNGNTNKFQQINPKKILKFLNKPVTEDNDMIPFMRCVMCERFPIFGRFSCERPNSHFLCRGCIAGAPTSTKEKKDRPEQRRGRKPKNASKPNIACPVLKKGVDGAICGSQVVPLLLGPMRIFEKSTFECPFDPCEEFGTGSADGLRRHMKMCKYRKRIPCHLNCGPENLPLIQYLPHLIENHEISVFEADKATLLLEITAQGFFTEENYYKHHGLGIFNVFSKHFLILATETNSKYFLYAVLLNENDDSDVKDNSTLGEYHCSFEIKPPTFKKDEGDGEDNLKVTLELDLSTPPTNQEMAKKFGCSKIRDPNQQDFHRLIELPLFSEMGMDKVLSLKESFSEKYDISQVFQLEKSKGKFYWIGAEKIALNVMIHKTNEVNVNASFGNFSSSLLKFHERANEGGVDAEFDFPYEDDYENMGPKKAAKAKKKKMNEHFELIKRMLKDERPTPSDLLSQLNYEANFGPGGHVPAALFKRNMFS